MEHRIDATESRRPWRLLVTRHVPSGVAIMLCATGFLVDVLAYYPGQMSFDSGYTWWQARGGETSNLQSLLLVYLWRVFDAILPGPGLVFILHGLLYWGGLLSIALALRLRPVAAAALVLLAGFAPAVFVLRAHVWTDVGLAGALLVSTGALAFLARTGKRRWLGLALVTSFYALGLRHNALPALLPVALYAMHRWLARGDWRPWRLRAAVASLFVLAVLYGLVQAINASADRDLSTWRALAVFDLAALSIAADRVLFPPDMVGPGMDVADLKQAHEPWSVFAVLTRTRKGIRDPISAGWTQAEVSELRRAWVAACLAHPREYLAHRLEFTAALFGTHPAPWPDELKFAPKSYQVRDNPPIAENATALHRWIIATALRLRDTPVFAAWPYLVPGIVAAPFAVLRRDRLASRIALIMLASAILYALPLVFLAPSAELRYLFWPCVASLVAAVLAFVRDGEPAASPAG